MEKYLKIHRYNLIILNKIMKRTLMKAALIPKNESYDMRFK